MRLIDADELLTDPYFADATIPEMAMAVEAIDDSPTIDPVYATGGCYCWECRHQEDCDQHVTHVHRDYILEQTVYEHNKLEWCGCGEKEDTNEKL